ncbi:hypothetical protein DB347_16250 [Opitutaceae bacterium EW11]|nr:hypothetical protein DB347_16250 [Opitutaceae bacterium EW11]
MTFHWPHVFWLMLIPLLLAVLELRRHRREALSLKHPKILRAEAGIRDLVLESDRGEHEPAAGNTARFRWRLIFGSLLFVVALARPQWGQLDEPVFDQAREIVIALDLSRSMLATDVRPSRLERARLLVTSLLERLSGERVGLIVFSGTAFLQSPLSSDYEILNEFLPALTPDYLPEGGTNYRSLVDTALSAFGSSGAADRFLIVLSDGEATDDDWKPAADELAKRGIRVIGLGLGTTQGSIIPDGSGGYVKDDRGAVVLSRLESATLQELASKTHGVYTDASSWVDLAQLLQSTVEAGRKGQFREERRVRLVERYQWALGPALLLLMASFWREFPVRPRPRNVRLRTRTGALPETQPQSGPGVAAALMLLFAAVLATPRTLSAAETSAAEPLSKLVAQFSSREQLTARDYAELARTTVTYGQRMKSAQQPVVEGVVHDGLAAVEAGRSLDANAADWGQIQSELEKLLEKPEPPPEQQQQQQEQNQDQNKDQQNQSDSQQKQQSGQPQQQPKQDQPQKSNEPKSEPTQGQPQQDQQDKKEPQRNAPSAFGDMKKNQPEKNQQKSSATPEIQKVGGSPEKETMPSDPRLVVPLEKLQQVRNQDSPVRLQQLLRGEKETPAKTGKNW